MVGLTRSNEDVVVVLRVVVSLHVQPIVALGQVVHLEDAVGISVALRNGFKGKVTFQGDFSTFKMRAVAVVGVPCIVVCNIYDKHSRGVRNCSYRVGQANGITSFAINGDGARILHQWNVVVRREAQREISRVVHSK